MIRQRLPLEIHEHVFTKVLQIAQEKKLLKGKAVAVDSTLIEAEAAMKSIVRRHSGDDWKEYVRKLAAEEGIDNPTDEDLRKFDKKRKGKKVGNDAWYNPHAPDARIAKMKDGRTHLAYKTEPAVDLESDLILAAPVVHADEADPQTLSQTLTMAQANLLLAGSDVEIKEVPADKGYHGTEALAWCQSFGIRTYIPERASRWGRRWTDKSQEEKLAVYKNRRLVRGKRGRHLGRLRSEHDASDRHFPFTGPQRVILSERPARFNRKRPRSPQTTPLCPLQRANPALDASGPTNPGRFRASSTSGPPNRQALARSSPWGERVLV